MPGSYLDVISTEIFQLRQEMLWLMPSLHGGELLQFGDAVTTLQNRFGFGSGTNANHGGHGGGFGASQFQAKLLVPSKLLVMDGGGMKASSGTGDTNRVKDASISKTFSIMPIALVTEKMRMVVALNLVELGGGLDRLLSVNAN